MVSIVDDLTRIANGRAEFIVEGGNVEELMDAAVSHMVIKKAGEEGLHRPGVSSASGPYPVDAHGNTDDALLLGKRGPVANYRRDFVVLASI